MALTAYSSETNGFVLHAPDAGAQSAPVGWVEGRGVGFRGFASPEDALAAAATAHEALVGWLDRDYRSRSTLQVATRITTRRDGPLTWLIAGKAPIGRLVSPLADMPGDSHGFELLLPAYIGPVTGLSVAQVIYHALAARPPRVRSSPSSSPSADLISEFELGRRPDPSR